MVKLRRVLFVVLLLSTLSYSQVAGNANDSDIKAALAKFITAFENLDWDGFRLSFDDDATVFYPRAVPERANGRSEFERTFRSVFEQIRGQQRTPPYMRIAPRDLKIQRFGDFAIVTFHLDDRQGFVNRRTIVMTKAGNAWKIIHLHASEVATSVKPQ